MILLLISLFINYIFGFTDIQIGYTSAIYKNNKIYVYEQYDDILEWSGLAIYNLKDGSISDIKPKTVNFTNSHPVYAPQFLQIPASLPDGKSDQLWMIGGLIDEELKENVIDKENWSCKIINDNELRFDDSLIPMPTFEKFPKGGFSQTIVNNNDNPILYIIGGLIYSKESNAELITNYFFKYEFSTGKWSDLSEATKSIVPPRAFHRVIEVDDSLLLIGGIHNNSTLSGNFGQTVTTKENASLSPINVVYKFDLNSQKWSSVKTKVNKDVRIYNNGTTAGPSFNLYNGKIISYMTLYNHEEEHFEPQIATLDHKTWEWEWHQVKNEAGTDNNLFLSYYQSLIINDQLIMIHGISNQKQSNKIFSINLKTYSLQGFINLTGNYGSSSRPKLLTWAIIIIVIASVVTFVMIIFAIWFYFRRKKTVKKEDRSEQKMQEVWSGSNHEAEGLKAGAGALAFMNSRSNVNYTDSTLIEDSIVNYECFQHEIDLQDLNDKKLHT